MHSIKTTRLLIIILVSVCSQVALGQSKERIIHLPEWSIDEMDEAQLELVEIKIAGAPIAIGESFDADENWLKAMTLRVKNVSKKPIITFVLVNGLFEGSDVELPPSAPLQYSIVCKWGKSSNPGKARTKRIVFKPGEILELNYAHVDELSRKVLAKGGEGAFCKLGFMTPRIRYEDGTDSFSPYMRFQRKQWTHWAAEQALAPQLPPKTRTEAACPLKCATSYVSSLQIGASYCPLSPCRRLGLNVLTASIGAEPMMTGVRTHKP